MLKSRFFIIIIFLLGTVHAQSLIEERGFDPLKDYGGEKVSIDGLQYRAVFLKFKTTDKTAIRAIADTLEVEVNSIFHNGIATAFIQEANLTTLRQSPDIEWIAPSMPVEPELDVSAELVKAHIGRTAAGVTGEDVIVGIVDTGINWSLDDFKTADGSSTRILSIWDQTYGSGTSPPWFNYGTEWTRTQINNQQCSEQDGISGHGTHVTGIAAGNGNTTGNDVPAGTYTGMAPQADIIMVKTYLNSASISDGVEYIANKAIS